MTKTLRRRGYALTLVLVFTLLLLSILSLAYRQLGAALRVESVRSAQTLRDQGSLQALARALAVLETGIPPTNPYECGVTIETSTGPRAFTITMSSPVDHQWTLQSVPTAANESPQPLPDTFLVP